VPTSILRSLRSRPGPSIVAVVCLALGIGVNLALVGMIDTLTYRPPTGVAEPESLVRVRLGASAGPVARGAGPAASYPGYARVAEEQADLFDGLAAYGGGSATRDAGVDARPITSTVVTANYFSVLGGRPHLGRFFDPAGAASGRGATEVVLSYRYWRQSFGAEAGVVGRTLRINGVPLTVIGVAREGFVGADLGDPDVWLPIGLRALPEFGGFELSASRGLYWLQLVGRLRDGVTLEQAKAVTGSDFADVDPFTAQPVLEAGDAPLPVTLLPLRTMFFADQRGRNPVPLWSLAISGAVLLLVCATVANLLLAQAVRRRREVAIRLALGGSPGRLVGAQIVEGLVLATFALGVATVVAVSSLGLLRRLPIPPLQGVLTPRALVVGLALTLLTPLLFGAAPALWTLRRQVGEVLRETGQNGVASASRLQRGFMVVQTAIGFVLLVSAGLFLESLENVRSVDAGIDLDRVLVASMERGITLGEPPSAELVTDALERVRRLPGVDAADVGNLIPYYLYSRSGFEITDGRPDEAQPTSTLVDVVGADYFDAMGIGIAAGRRFGANDGPGSAPVAMVSESLARLHWPDRSPLGACLRLGGPYDDTCVEVVGVAADTRIEDLLGEPSAVLYLADAQLPPEGRSSRLFVRAAGDRAQVAAAVRTELQSLRADMPFVDVEPLDERLGPQLVQWRVGSGLFSALGALAALLGAIGVYSVVSFAAAQRTREIGIRSALGAGRERLLGAELRSVVTLSLVGIGCGGVAALLTARAYDAQLYGLRAFDVPTYATVAALLLVIAVVAGLRPAWRASRADPAVVLREE
jgi:putative ABC transport system permease protein